MTLEKAIRLADLLVPNTLEQELKIQWLNEVEGLVQTEVMRVSIDQVVGYDGEDLSVELLLTSPHDMLYRDYLVAQIHFAHQEYNLYETARAKFNAGLKIYTRWFLNTWQPGAAPGWYLTAYGLAVKRGFEGSEEEWLASLIGPTGAAAMMRYDAERGYVQWSSGGEWVDLMPVSEIQGAVVAATLEWAEKYAETARQAAADAEAARAAAVEAQGNAAASAQDAMRAAETAAALAGSAEGSAGAAADNAVAAAQAAVAAQEALNEAKTAHADTERLAVRAEAAAQEAGAAAQEAGAAAQEAWAAAAAAGKSNRLTLETEQSSDGDAGVVLEPEGTAEEPVLGLYGLNGDEPVRITHAAPAQADDDVPTLGQVRELAGEAGGVYVLADGESLEDAPEDADVVIVPDAGEDLTFAGATEALDGTAGFVPAPVAGDQCKFLRGDGTWMDVLQVIRENYPAAEEVAF